MEGETLRSSPIHVMVHEIKTESELEDSQFADDTPVTTADEELSESKIDNLEPDFTDDINPLNMICETEEVVKEESAIIPLELIATSSVTDFQDNNTDSYIEHIDTEDSAVEVGDKSNIIQQTCKRKLNYQADDSDARSEKTQKFENESISKTSPETEVARGNISNAINKKRGRPRKLENDDTPKSNKKVGRPRKTEGPEINETLNTPRKVGRPRKNDESDPPKIVGNVREKDESEITNTPRKVGRPRKTEESEINNTSKTPKKVGRPRKTEESERSDTTNTPRKVGRPRKIETENESSTELAIKQNDAENENCPTIDLQLEEKRYPGRPRKCIDTSQSYGSDVSWSSDGDERSSDENSCTGKRKYIKGKKRVGRPAVGVSESNVGDGVTTKKNLVTKPIRHRKPLLQCEYCEFSTVSEIYMLQHDTIHTKVKHFRCDICDTPFRVKLDMIRHKVKHSDEKNFKCPHCDFTTKWRANIRHHILRHTTDRPFKCDICDLAFKRTQDLRTHLYRHNDIKPLKCGKCEFRCKTPYELKFHQLKHSDVRPYKCTHQGCTRACKTGPDLTKHLKTHSDIREHKCPLCSAAFKSITARNKHLKRHSDDRPFQCEICQKSFKTKSCLRKHITLHMDARPFTCDVCDKGFSSKSNMMKHKETHNTLNRPFICPICPCGATSKHSLLAHIGTMHGDDFAYFCELCKKPFRRYSNLTIHYTRMHSKNELESIPSVYDLKPIIKTEPRDEIFTEQNEQAISETVVQIKQEIEDSEYGDCASSDKAHDRTDLQNPAVASTSSSHTVIPKKEPDDEPLEAMEGSCASEPEPKKQGPKAKGKMKKKIAPRIETKECQKTKDEGTLRKQSDTGLGCTATLAMYDDFRLPLATKGFKFNLDKTGKKPKTWFMNPNNIAQSDAKLHQLEYMWKKMLRTHPELKRKASAYKNLSKQGKITYLKFHLRKYTEQRANAKPVAFKGYYRCRKYLPGISHYSNYSVNSLKATNLNQKAKLAVVPARVAAAAAQKIKSVPLRVRLTALPKTELKSDTSKQDGELGEQNEETEGEKTTENGILKWYYKGKPIISSSQNQPSSTVTTEELPSESTSIKHPVDKDENKTVKHSVDKDENKTVKQAVDKDENETVKHPVDRDENKTVKHPVDKDENKTEDLDNQGYSLRRSSRMNTSYLEIEEAVDSDDIDLEEDKVHVNSVNCQTDEIEIDGNVEPSKTKNSPSPKQKGKVKRETKNRNKQMGKGKSSPKSKARKRKNVLAAGKDTEPQEDMHINGKSKRESKNRKETVKKTSKKQKPVSESKRIPKARLRKKGSKTQLSKSKQKIVVEIENLEEPSESTSDPISNTILMVNPSLNRSLIGRQQDSQWEKPRKFNYVHLNSNNFTHVKVDELNQEEVTAHHMEMNEDTLAQEIAIALEQARRKRDEERMSFLRGRYDRKEIEKRGTIYAQEHNKKAQKLQSKKFISKGSSVYQNFLKTRKNPPTLPANSLHASLRRLGIPQIPQTETTDIDPMQSSYLVVSQNSTEIDTKPVVEKSTEQLESEVQNSVLTLIPVTLKQEVDIRETCRNDTTEKQAVENTPRMVNKMTSTDLLGTPVFPPYPSRSKGMTEYQAEQKMAVIESPSFPPYPFLTKAAFTDTASSGVEAADEMNSELLEAVTYRIEKDTEEDAVIPHEHVIGYCDDVMNLSPDKNSNESLVEAVAMDLEGSNIIIPNHEIKVEKHLGYEITYNEQDTYSDNETSEPCEAVTIEYVKEESDVPMDLEY